MKRNELVVMAFDVIAIVIIAAAMAGLTSATTVMLASLWLIGRAMKRGEGERKTA